MYKKLLLPIGVLATAAIISIVITAARPAPLKLESPDTALAVKTLVLNASSAQLHVESQGTVLPRTRTKLISEVSGAVLSVSSEFVVGGTFEKGDILLQLSNRLRSRPAAGGSTLDQHERSIYF